MSKDLKMCACRIYREKVNGVMEGELGGRCAHCREVEEVAEKAVTLIGSIVRNDTIDFADYEHWLTRAEACGLGRESFFSNVSIEELAESQNVKPLRSIAVLSGGIPEDDVDAFLREIYESRK